MVPCTLNTNLQECHTPFFLKLAELAIWSLSFQQLPKNGTFLRRKKGTYHQCCLTVCAFLNRTQETLDSGDLQPTGCLRDVVTTFPLFLKTGCLSRWAVTPRTTWSLPWQRLHQKLLQLWWRKVWTAIPCLLSRVHWKEDMYVDNAPW